MLPVITAFKKAHQLRDITVVADAGMISEANQIAIASAGLDLHPGARLPFLPDIVREWRDQHPGQDIPEDLTLTQPWPATDREKTRGIPERVIHYQYRGDRARRSLRGIDEQIAKAQKAVDGKAPVKRNRFITLTGESKAIDRDLEAKARPWPVGRATPPTWSNKHRSSSSAPTTTCGASRKHSGCPNTTYRPARSTTTNGNRSTPTSRSFFAAMAITHWIEQQTGWSIKQFVRTARRYCTITIQPENTLTAADPIPDDLAHALNEIHRRNSAH